MFRLLGKVINQLRGDESEAQSSSDHLLMQLNIELGCFNYSSILENGKSHQKHPSKLLLQKILPKYLMSKGWQFSVILEGGQGGFPCSLRILREGENFLGLYFCFSLFIPKKTAVHPENPHSWDHSCPSPPGSAAPDPPSPPAPGSGAVTKIKRREHPELITSSKGPRHAAQGRLLLLSGT